MADRKLMSDENVDRFKRALAKIDWSATVVDDAYCDHATPLLMESVNLILCQLELVDLLSDENDPEQELRECLFELTSASFCQFLMGAQPIEDAGATVDLITEEERSEHNAVVLKDLLDDEGVDGIINCLATLYEEKARIAKMADGDNLGLQKEATIFDQIGIRLRHFTAWYYHG